MGGINEGLGLMYMHGRNIVNSEGWLEKNDD